VTWFEAEAFGKAYGARLPTEAQWEYACRAGTLTDFHFGDALNGAAANCKGTEPFGTVENGPFLERTTKVASYQANAFGLYDMHGNVNEWCRDWYSDKTGDLGEKDPERSVKRSASRRVLRGGPWPDGAALCRAACRSHKIVPENRYASSGFRIIVDLPSASPPSLLHAPFTKEQAEKARAEWAAYLKVPERKQLDLGKGAKLDLVLIPPGQFRMGTEGDKGNEVAHDVTITKPFYMAVTETTQEQYEAVTGKNPSCFSAKGGGKPKLVPGTDTSNYPVELVSWVDADAFGKKIGARLPTEAQQRNSKRNGQ
jgi:formylglycine-generating enzyme required for sulfatase activity